jgi:hypothetical protein
MFEPTARLGRIAILWRGDEAARRSASPETSRFEAVFGALADVGVDAEPVVYEDDVLDALRAPLAMFDGVLVWVNPIHEGRSRANLDALLREVAARGVWVSAHPDVILKMGTKEVYFEDGCVMPRRRVLSCYGMDGGNTRERPRRGDNVGTITQTIWIVDGRARHVR